MGIPRNASGKSRGGKRIDPARVGTRIKYALSERGLTPRDLADHLGLEYTGDIYRWMKGEKLSGVTADRCMVIAEFLDVPVGWLLEGDVRTGADSEGDSHPPRRATPAPDTDTREARGR